LVFCEKPTDVECQAVGEDNNLYLHKDEYGCSLTGFVCPLFCFDFEIRFHCCHCIPDDNGDPFRIHLYSDEPDKNGVYSDFNNCLFYDENAGSIRYGNKCNDDSSIFTWVSQSKLKLKDQLDSFFIKI
jgi:hypothetical protein